MTPLLRVRADRLSALQSTGPRTPAGKAKSSANSLKHGLRRCKPVLLPGESAVQWKKFAQETFEDLQPRGPVQMMWAGRVALLMWKLRSTADARKILLDRQWREAEILAHALSQLRSLQSQTPEQSSTNPEQTSQNVVQLGSVSLETPVKQA